MSATDLRLVLPGASGSYAATPDSAALDSISDDLTIVVQFVEFSPSAPAATQGLVSRNSGSPNRSWVLWQRNSDGKLELYISNDGSAWSAAVFAATATYLTDGVWLKVESLVSGTRTTRWYTSTDGESWTLRETSAGSPTATTIYNNNQELQIGANGGSSLFDGQLGNVKVYDGDEATGTLVADFDPQRDALLGLTSFVSSATGETWTLAGGALLTAADVRLDWVNADVAGVQLPHLRPLRGLDIAPSRWSAASSPQLPGARLTQPPIFDPRAVTVPVLLRPDPPYTRARLEAERARYAAALVGGSSRVGALRVADGSGRIRELVDVIYVDGLAGSDDMPGHDLPVLLFQALDPHFYNLDDETDALTTGTNTLTVIGDAEPRPVFTVTGGASSNITSVTLERVDTGDTITVALTSALTTGVALVIDCAAYTVQRAGTSVFADLTDAGFFTLAAGSGSQVELTLGGTAGSYTAAVSYRPRWLTAWGA